MIAFASRYGHQPLLMEMGPITAQRLDRFNSALKEFVDNEQKNGRTHAMNMADGGG